VVDRLRLPPEQTSRQAYDFPGEGQFRSRHDTHRQSKIIRGGETACPGAKSRVTSLLPTFAGRERTLWRLKSPISRTPLLEAPSAHQIIRALAIFPHHTKSYKIHGGDESVFHSPSDDSYRRIAHAGLPR
jgi:hypothetical protein